MAGTPKNIKNLMSFGSPFWGSPTANFGQEFLLERGLAPSDKFFSPQNIFFTAAVISSSNGGPAPPFPIRQAYRLAIGSAGISWQRNKLLNLPSLKDPFSGEKHL